MNNFLIFLDILAIILVYLTFIKGYTLRQIYIKVTSIFKKIYKWIAKKMTICSLRSQAYSLGQDSKDFERKMLELGICKYFKFLNYKIVKKDITELHFRILKISDEYSNNLSALKSLIGTLLLDFYAERLPNDSIPTVYIKYITDDIVSIWVASNKHGDILIQKEIETDENRTLPNVGDIEDE